MNRPIVKLDDTARAVVLEEVLYASERYGMKTLALSVSPTHMHLLAKFPMERRVPKCDKLGRRTSSVDDPVRHLVGQIKQWSSKRLIRDGILEAGAWGKRGKIVPVKDRGHQVNTYRYIAAHGQEGALVWSAITDE